MGDLRTALVAIGVFVLSASGAAGQEGGGYIDWGMLKTPDPAGAYTRGYELGQRMAADRAAQARADAEGAERAAGAARAKEAGRLIASGRCADARAYALGEGDLDLATRVTAFCAGK